MALTICGGLFLQACDGDGESAGDGDGDGDPYGDPSNGCLDGETNIGLVEIDGVWCAGSCEVDADCAMAPGTSSAVPGCYLDDGMGGGLCGLSCTVSDGGGACPTGMDCQDLMDPDYSDTGGCTWPEG